MAGNLTWAQVAAKPGHIASRHPAERPGPSRDPTKQVIAGPKRLAAKHPAEVSGPSRDPEKQLMGLPRELRDEIWRYVYVKAGHVKLRCIWQANRNRLPQTVPTKPEGIISMLCANKQTMKEGLHILYGENHFEFYHDRVFGINTLNYDTQHPYVNGIGLKNAATIKTATYEIPGSIMEGYQDGITFGPSLQFLSRLVGLKKLTIKVETFVSLWDIGNVQVVKVKKKQSTRAILTTAARVTKYHPNLRKAVWRYWSGGDTKTGGLLTIFYIDLFQEGCAPALRSATTKDADGKDVQSRDEVAKFKLPDKIDPSPFLADSNSTNTKSSETDPRAVTTWPGLMIYDPLLELSYNDQVDLVRHRKGTFLKGEFIAGDMVNGIFVKGHWFGSNFVEGDWTPPRYVNGKVVLPRFTPGKWIGNKLVQGKMIDGMFVQGRWEMEQFTQGKWDGERFIEGKWEGAFRFLKGKWTKGHFTEERDRYIVIGRGHGGYVQGKERNGRFGKSRGGNNRA
ncbi:hypothetical protein H2200_006877 [Cladophialophora chaetospira]|uniref:Uncharacterized protein n=1 Tax=Cladophialophora chaetospira TaxID=386627 RepID=A0AA38X919_9EURO|nr:hypothetical protein H2200_006877 [Cladophialophora chaetospira]